MKNLTKTIWNAAIIFAIALMSFQCGDEDIDVENVFTEDNYLYEGDLYKRYLNSIKEQTIKERDSLQAIIDNNQGNLEVEEELEDTEEELNLIDGEFNSILDVVARGIAPRPIPCPDDDIISDLCFPNFRKLIFENDRVVSFRIMNENDDVIYDKDAVELMTVPGFENEASMQCDEELNDFQGMLKFSVERINSNGKVVKYTQ